MTKINAAALFSVAALTLTLASPLLAADRLKAGQWELTSTVTGQEPRTVKHCVTPVEAKSVNGSAQEVRAATEKSAGKECTLPELNIVGDTVSFKLVCGPAVVKVTVTYHGDSFESQKTTNVGGKEITSHEKARFLGACP